MEILECCLCGKVIESGFGNNPDPLPVKNEDDECCDACNYEKVIPARMEKYETLKTLERILTRMGV
jgi:hypothetical protein